MYLCSDLNPIQSKRAATSSTLQNYLPPFDSGPSSVITESRFGCACRYGKVTFWKTPVSNNNDHILMDIDVLPQWALRLVVRPIRVPGISTATPPLCNSGIWLDNSRPYVLIAAISRYPPFEGDEYYSFSGHTFSIKLYTKFFRESRDPPEADTSLRSLARYHKRLRHPVLSDSPHVTSAQSAVSLKPFPVFRQSAWTA